MPPACQPRGVGDCCRRAAVLNHGTVLWEIKARPVWSLPLNVSRRPPGARCERVSHAPLPANPPSGTCGTSADHVAAQRAASCDVTSFRAENERLNPRSERAAENLGRCRRPNGGGSLPEAWSPATRAAKSSPAHRSSGGTSAQRCGRIVGWIRPRRW
jgi:hypothetical protein